MHILRCIILRTNLKTVFVQVNYMYVNMGVNIDFMNINSGINKDKSYFNNLNF